MAIYDKQIKVGSLVKFNNWSPEKQYYTCYGRVKKDLNKTWLIEITKNHHAEITKCNCEKVLESNGSWIIGNLFNL